MDFTTLFFEPLLERLIVNQTENCYIIYSYFHYFFFTHEDLCIYFCVVQLQPVS